MNFWYESFDAAPTVLAISFPPLNNIKEGMDLIPYFIAISWFSSTFNFATFILPAIICDNCSTTGPTILHGPHHSAQKSTKTGKSDFRTSLSHNLVLTYITFLFLSSIMDKIYTLYVF